MKITLFTGNQPRHLSLARTLAEVSNEVFVVQECTTVFPGQVEDFFRKSEVMQTYFRKVMDAEATVFGALGFAPPNVRTLSIRTGDLSNLALSILAPALECDLAIVFGASWIRGPLIERLVGAKAINIHMGVSPYYRGSSCNFWALYDRKPDLVGATIHRLSRGLDSGDILFHTLPNVTNVDPFELGMRAVRSAHLSLAEAIRSGSIADAPVKQDRSLQIRYTKAADFTDNVAADYLSRALNAEQVAEMIAAAPSRSLNRVVRC